MRAEAPYANSLVKRWRQSNFVSQFEDQMEYMPSSEATRLKMEGLAAKGGSVIRVFIVDKI